MAEQLSARTGAAVHLGNPPYGGHTSVQMQIHTTNPDFLARTAAEYREQHDKRVRDHFEAARTAWMKTSPAYRELQVLEARHKELLGLAEASAQAAAKAQKTYDSSLTRGTAAKAVEALAARDRTAAEAAAARKLTEDLEPRVTQARAKAAVELAETIHQAAHALVLAVSQEHLELVQKLGQPLLEAAVSLAVLQDLRGINQGLGYAGAQRPAGQPRPLPPPMHEYTLLPTDGSA